MKVTRKLFELALQADQSTLLSAVERYTRNIAEDIGKLQTSVNENGKRLLDINSQARERQERVELWQARTGEEIRKIDEDAQAHFQASKRWHQDTGDDIKELRHSQEDRKHQEIITWISALDFSMKQTDVFSRRQDGTAEWLFDNDAFMKWRDGAERVLYCPGIPGAGKTVLASTVVNYLQRLSGMNNIALAYIFCSYKEQEDQTTSNLIANLALQLAQKDRLIPENIRSLYEHHTRRGTRPTLNEWSKVPQSQVLQFSRVFIIIDALDECTGCTRESLIAEIHELPLNTYLFVTSRHIPTIQSAFRNASVVEVYGPESDIKKYLQCCIKKDCRLSSILRPEPSLQETIVDIISKRTRGMFLLAQLHVDLLARKHSRRDIRTALQSLPKELDETYNEVMKRIRSQNKEDTELAERVLSWLSFTLKPLSITELQHALAVESGRAELDHEALIDEDLLVSVCAGLVAIDYESRTIRLVHYTAQEYFERVNLHRVSQIQHDMALTCLTYISYDVFANGYCSNDQELEAWLHRHPFFKYAAQHWGHHARAAAERTIENTAFKFLSHGSNLERATQVMHLSGYPYSGYSLHFPKGVTGLQIVASFGLEEIVKLLLKNGAGVDVADDNGWTALHRAAENGHEAVVRLLLEMKADVNAIARYGGTPLHRAAKNGDAAVALLLLNNGANVYLEDQYGGTALHRAAKQGHEPVARLLLKSGAEANRSYNFKAVENLLTQNGIRYNIFPPRCPSGYYCHEWMEVSKVTARLTTGNCDFEQLLGGTALHEAANSGHEAVVQLLLDNSADVNVTDNFEGTALHRAAKKGYDAVAQMLIMNGVNIDRKYNLGRAARLLLKEGACHGHIDGETALHEAAKSGHDTVVQLLLHNGADNSSKDAYKFTPLHHAARKGHLEVVRLLLENGAEVDAEAIHPSTIADKCDCMVTALYMAAEKGNETIVRLLIQKGANANFQGKQASESSSYVADKNHERTVLQVAVLDNHEGTAQLLLESGAEVNKITSYGRSKWGPPEWDDALGAAVFDGTENIVRLLLDNGANVKRDGARMLDLAKKSKPGHEKAIRQLLLEWGATEDQVYPRLPPVASWRLIPPIRCLDD